MFKFLLLCRALAVPATDPNLPANREKGSPKSPLPTGVQMTTFWRMRSVGIKLLKNKLSEYIRLADAIERDQHGFAAGSWPNLVRRRLAGAR
jgi:hypothetical protein